MSSQHQTQTSKSRAFEEINKSLPLPTPSREEIGKTFDKWKSASNDREEKTTSREF